MSPAQVPLTWQIAALEREIAAKEARYPALIAAGRIKPAAAEMQLRDLKAALATLRRVCALDPLSTPGGTAPPPPPPHFAA